VSDADALFCAHCGASLRDPDGPPTTVTLPDEPAILPAPLAPPVAPAPSTPPAQPSATAPADRATNRQAAYVGLGAAAVAAVGAFQVWLRIHIAGFIPPGSAETGWKSGDGRTIVVAAVVAAVAAGALLIGRHDLWLKVALLIAGGVSFVIALVNMVDVGSKAHDIQVQFGIPEGDVRAQIGWGLYLVAAGGAGLITAGLAARTAS
jgi:hypothetical protein